MHGRQKRKEHLTNIGLNKLSQLCYRLNKHNQKKAISFGPSVLNFEVEDIVHN